MNHTATSRPPGEIPDGSFEKIHWIIFGLFLLAYGLTGAGILFGISSLEKSGGPPAFLVFLAAVTTLIALSRQLPAQNILLAAGIIGVIGSAAQLLGARTGIPFGPFSYTDEAGPRVLDAVAWFSPLVWVVAILNSRGVARLILPAVAQDPGVWILVIGLTIALTLLLDSGLEPFATRVKHYWLWHPTKFPLDWEGAPASNFLGWLMTAVIILAFATPALMKRKPARSKPDYHPLMVWLLLDALFIAGAVTQRLWPAAGLSAAAGVIAAIFAVRGARW